MNGLGASLSRKSEQQTLFACNVQEICIMSAFSAHRAKKPTTTCKKERIYYLKMRIVWARSANCLGLVTSRGGGLW